VAIPHFKSCGVEGFSTGSIIPLLPQSPVKLLDMLRLCRIHYAYAMMRVLSNHGGTLWLYTM